MEAVLLPKSWNVDQILDDLDQHGFAIIDDAYSDDYVHQLIEECTSNLNRFREAAIQNGVISKIRSDHILWLHPELHISNRHVQSLFSLGQELNRAFYLGIRDVEASGEYDERDPVNVLKPLPNMTVLIVKGPFQGFPAMVVEGGDPDTVKCDVGVFGGTVPVFMPLDHVEVS